MAHDPKADDFPAKFVGVLRGVNVAPALINLLRNDVRHTSSLPRHPHMLIVPFILYF